jgi:hypothetical protein
MTKQTIRVHYTSIDGVHKTRAFNDIVAAQLFAQDMLGECPEIGSHYAVSGDGVGKITVNGATLAQLFPRAAF